jgi:hypothetical protein
MSQRIRARTWPWRWLKLGGDPPGGVRRAGSFLYVYVPAAIESPTGKRIDTAIDKVVGGLIELVSRGKVAVLPGDGP